MSRRSRLNSKRRRNRILAVSVLAAIVALVAVLYLIVQTGTSTPNSVYVGKPIPLSLYQTVTGVSDQTLAAVGVPSSITPPTSISGPALTLNGKPEVLYIGGEYCPFCAVERWGMVVALGRFGTFSGLQYMLSSATDTNANSPTFTFANATYTSQYISFLAVEEYDSAGNVRQPLTSDQQSLVTNYDTCPSSPSSGGGIPFVDFSNAYAVNCGVQTSLNLMGQNWTKDVAPMLNNPNSPTAIGIDGTANTLIAAICKIDGGQPLSVCSQPYAKTVAYTSSQETIQQAIATVPLRREMGWTV